MRRRHFVYMSGMGVISLFAGCSTFDNSQAGDDDSGAQNQDERDSDNDGVIDSRDDFPNDSSLSTTLFEESDTRNIEEDEWYYYQFELSESGEIHYDFVVREGPSIDVIIMSESEYEYFSDGDRYERYPALSTFDSVGDQVQTGISSGEYRIIFDNSYRSEAQPPANLANDVATVEFSLGVYQ